MTLELSIVTLFVLIGGGVLLVAGIGCERISRVVEGLRRHQSTRIVLAVLGLVMVVGAVPPQVYAAQDLLSVQGSIIQTLIPTASAIPDIKPTPMAPIHKPKPIIPGP